MKHDKRDEFIAKLYRSGLTLQAIASRYGLTRERVRQILRRDGVPSMGLKDRGGRARQRPMSEAELRAVTLYASGKYPTEVAAATGLSVQEVSLAIRLAGLKRHGVGRKYDTPERAATDAKVVELYLSGVSTTQIMRTVQGVNTPPRIYRALKRNGIAARREPFGHHLR